MPTLLVEWRTAQVQQPVLIKTIRWVGMRCGVETENAPDGYRLDARTKVADPDSSIVVSTALPAIRDNKGSLFVDDGEEGKAVNIVLTDNAGQIIARQSTTVGG